MVTQAHSTHDASNDRVRNPSEGHNASVHEGAAGQGACAQLHLPTGGMCTMRHAHKGSCEFSPVGEADAVLAQHKAAEHW
jgi:hypothetical protein